MAPAANSGMGLAPLPDATRRDTVLLPLAGCEGVAELAGHFPISFAAVQKHVAVPERAGLVTKERTGRRKVVRQVNGGRSPHGVWTRDHAPR